ncbi:carotenoid oxygenase family protein [Achromobacter seleniivolatilans]|uniref:Carotenoid oxygenase family protein n=1 Tax=Achromobacter seleniivolatilans TaxID=3047478 RepID=A0ABY9M2S7_9BURK|nr:carotenoid oxygenase family protein [Achromobacter sp. R39]WMD21321.1 carotenoid oxygenase family protein [Achromobacter sp. R39]
MQPWQSTNVALTRAFAPVFDERDDTPLRVDGMLPKTLHGVFMRNGPNPQFDPGPGYAYPFDGTGMIHALTLREGTAHYRNRWVLTEELQEERRAGRRLYNVTFGPPPHANLANTNILRHAGKLLALYEGGCPYEMDRSLSTIGPYTFQGKHAGVLSAHPKVDPVSGEMLALSYDLAGGTLSYLRVNARGQVDRNLRFESPWPAMIHDIGFTAKHVVAFLCPLVFDFSKGPAAPQWEPNRGARILLIPRDCTDPIQVRWIPTEPFFHWHIANAHEEGNTIEAVMPWYDGYGPSSRKRLELHRLRIHLDSGRVEDQALDDRPCEFGRINDAWSGRRARYCYVGLRDPHPGDTPQPGAFEAFARYDMGTGAKTVFRLPDGQTACEPVFAADPQGSREEDGYILSFVQANNDNHGEFIVLDARDIAAGPVARVHLPRRVPAGLHGSWLPA